jgi:glycosyltransferase involved in cell wall biosynthesis
VRVLCQLFYPELVSTGQVLTELCEELVQLGMDVEVVCAPPTILHRKSKVPKYIEYKGIHIRRVWGTRLPKLKLAGRVINQVTFAVSAFLYLLFHPSKRPVLVVTNPPFLAVACAFLRLLRIGGPYIYLIHDVFPDSAVNLGVLRKDGLIVRVWNSLNFLVFKYAAAIIVIGRCMRDVVLQKLKKYGLNSQDKVHKIHVWSDDRLIRSASGKPNPVVSRWHLDGKFVVGYFGNMGRLHDMETIMAAAKALNDNRDIVFLFVGEGHKKQSIMVYANEHNLSNCQFHSYVDREELGYLMHSADIGIVSLAQGQEGLSVPSKTFGLMAAGVPVVGVLPGVSEIAMIVQEEQCGVVVEPGQGEKLAEYIKQIRGDRERLQRMGENGSRAIDIKYSFRDASKQYFNLITEVNGGNSI